VQGLFDSCPYLFDLAVHMAIWGSVSSGGHNMAATRRANRDFITLPNKRPSAPPHQNY
jgi:hypothetical protein